MPKSSAPRKKYTPRPVLANPISYVLTGFKPVRGADADRIKIISHGSMHALTTGTGTRADWELICNALNVAVVLAERDIGGEYIEQIRNAMIAHAQCGKRLFKGGTLGYTGEQMSVVNFALDVHDAQVDIATIGDMEFAHLEVKKRLRDKKLSYVVKELVKNEHRLAPI